MKQTEEIESIEEGKLEAEFEESKEGAIEEVLETEEVEEGFTEDTRLEELQKKYDLLNEEFTKLKEKYDILMEEKNARELLEKEEICNKVLNSWGRSIKRL